MRCVRLFICICCILAMANSKLTPVVQDNSEHEYLLRIIWKYDKFMRYQNFITFVGDFDVKEGHKIAPSIQVRIAKTFGRPLIIAGPETGSLRQLIGAQNLGMVVFSDIHDPVLTVVQNTFKGLTLLHTMFVYKPKVNAMPITDLIEAFFNWCWKINLHNTILIFKRNNEHELWKYLIRSSIFIFRITDQRLQTFTNGSNSILRGYQVQIAFFHSPPYIFVYNSTDQRDLTGKNVSLGGPTGIMIAEFLRTANGTMRILQTSRADYCPDSTQCRIGDKNIDIGGNLVSRTSLSLYSPLVVSTKYCLAVPYERLVPLRKYLPLLLFGDWSMMAFFVFYFTVIIVIIRLSTSRMPLFLLFWKAFQLSAGLGLSTRLVRRLGLSEKIMFICSLFYEMLTVGILVSAVTTAITMGIRMPQIVDIDSFVANDMDIMITASQMNEVFHIDKMPREFSDRMIFVDQSTLDHHLNSLNDSYIYVIETHRWAQFQFMQEHLRQPKIKLASGLMCSVERHLRLPINSDILLTYVLRKFIGRSSETGLNEKWMRMGLQQLKKAKIIRQHPYDPPTLKKLPLKFFTISIQLYAMGISLSLIVLLGEFVYMRWMNRLNDNVI